MMYEHETVIELSKNKVVLLTLGASLFVTLGIWLLQLQFMVGILAISFFGLCLVFSVAKLFDKKPGLILNEEGLIDNSSGVSAGFIPWSEVTGFSIFEIQKQKMLVVGIRNPEKYIEHSSSLKRMINKANYNLCGSPVAITSNTLKMKFDELTSLCNQYYTRYGKISE
uniref:Photosystem I assembly protein Ycf4 n=1 Tax=Gracilinema caldarium TaxID=215591 RepID=A0A7C3IHS4_9SPIR